MSKSCRICPQLFFLLSVPAFALAFILTILTVILLLPFAWLKSRKAIRILVVIWTHLVFLFMGKRLDVKGRHHITDGQKYILLANHGSLFDILAIMSFYPDVSWFGREHLLRIPVFGRLLRMINYVPMKASDIRNAREMIHELTERTKDHTIAIFPEGTRTLDGSINRFRKGFLHVMKASERNLLPVTLNGFYHFKPKNRFYINFGSQLGIVVHAPINFNQLEDKSDNEILEHVQKTIKSAYIPNFKK